jgi:hypothetical protein
VSDWNRAFVFIGVAVAGFGAMVWFGPTFGNRCSARYEAGTEKWELCVQRLAAGHGVNYIKRVELVPVD